jgi:hypothetical protein
MGNATSPIHALVNENTLRRFWAKVEPDGECQIWRGALVGAGYGHFCQGGDKRMMLAHRWSYEAANGPVPDGLVIDHLCMNKACVNPAHLDAVTQAVNIDRNPNAVNKRNALVASCPRGHEYTEANTRWYRNGRHCRSCARIHTANYRARKAA